MNHKGSLEDKDLSILKMLNEYSVKRNLKSLLEKEVLDGSEIDAIVREFGGNGGDPLAPSAAAAVA